MQYQTLIVSYEWYDKHYLIVLIMFFSFCLIIIIHNSGSFRREVNYVKRDSNMAAQSTLNVTGWNIPVKPHSSVLLPKTSHNNYFLYSSQTVPTSETTVSFCRDVNIAYMYLHEISFIPKGISRYIWTHYMSVRPSHTAMVNTNVITNPFTVHNSNILRWPVRETDMSNFVK
jgi:hypothetical protein